MSMVEPVPATIASSKTLRTRVESIDIFRGLTMMVMIFVNDLAGVPALPWWTYHAHEQQDLMTYVDMVFPFFLFIVGMSMPLAIARRLEKNPSHFSLWWHIVARSVGLVILGLILANAEKGDPARMHMPIAVWALLALSGAVLTWLVPSRDARRAKLYQALRMIGILILIFTFAIFRRTTSDGSAAWIDASYPEILGIIGFTYFAVALLYVPTRRWLWAPLGWFLGPYRFLRPYDCSAGACAREFAVLFLAIWCRRFRIHHDGWNRHFCYFSWQTSMALTPAENVAGGGIRRLCTRCR